MKALKIRKPFIFWLAQQLLPAGNKNNQKPISDREFYGILTMIILALCILKVLF